MISTDFEVPIIPFYPDFVLWSSVWMMKSQSRDMVENRP